MSDTPPEVQLLIIKQLVLASRVSPDGRSSHPSKYAVVQKFWAKVIQSVLYRKCNLVDVDASKSFFGSVVHPLLGTPGPGRFVVVFSISFVPDRDQTWWALLRGALSEMTNLVTFCFAYSHKQEDSFEQYARIALSGLFSDSLKNIIIRPNEEECGEVSCSLA